MFRKTAKSKRLNRSKRLRKQGGGRKEVLLMEDQLIMLLMFIDYTYPKNFY